MRKDIVEAVMNTAAAVVICASSTMQVGGKLLSTVALSLIHI